MGAMVAAMLVLVQGRGMAEAAEPKDIVTTAVEAGTFKTLAAALQAGGLVETLQSKGPFTVFAPSDAAFAKLPAGTLETLLKPENKGQLVAILKFHVVAGRVYSTDLLKAREAKTLNGAMLNATVSDGIARVNGAGLVATDIDASNGVIHVIDTVLLPPAAPAKGAHVAPEPAHVVSHDCPQTGRRITWRTRMARR
ncbi:MAG: fasciclin domain-containing protein [Planctomycetes bacterium]|nr:fasciclin domain-containing protein [Planctomycetota bacterium]